MARFFLEQMRAQANRIAISTINIRCQLARHGATVTIYPKARAGFIVAIDGLDAAWVFAHRPILCIIRAALDSCDSTNIPPLALKAFLREGNQGRHL